MSLSSDWGGGDFIAVVCADASGAVVSLLWVMVPPCFAFRVAIFSTVWPHCGVDRLLAGSVSVVVASRFCRCFQWGGEMLTRAEVLVQVCVLFCICGSASFGGDELPVLQAGLSSWYEAVTLKCDYQYFRGVVPGGVVEELEDLDWESKDPHGDLMIDSLGHGSMVKMGDVVRFSIEFNEPFKVVGPISGVPLADGQVAVTNIPIQSLSDSETEFAYRFPGEVVAENSFSGHELRARQLFADAAGQLDLPLQYLQWLTPISSPPESVPDVLQLPFEQSFVETSTVRPADSIVVVNQTYYDERHSYSFETELGCELSLPYLRRFHAHIEQLDADRRVVADRTTLYRRFKTVDGVAIASRVVSLSGHRGSVSVDVFDAPNLGESAPVAEDLQLVVSAEAVLFGVREEAIPVSDGVRLVSLSRVRDGDVDEEVYFNPQSGIEFGQANLSEPPRTSSLFLVGNSAILIVVVVFFLLRRFGRRS